MPTKDNTSNVNRGIVLDHEKCELLHLVEARKVEVRFSGGVDNMCSCELESFNPVRYELTSFMKALRALIITLWLGIFIYRGFGLYIHQSLDYIALIITVLFMALVTKTYSWD